MCNEINYYDAIGLSNIQESSFNSQNLIIGKNGSGKTRFLKALEDKIKQKNPSAKVITLYFPEIQAFFKEIKNTDEYAETNAYDYLMGNEKISFIDFLKIIEYDRANFLQEILLSLRFRGYMKANGTEVLNRLNSNMEAFFEKRISINEKKDTITIDTIKDNKICRSLNVEPALCEFSPGELMLFYLCVFLTLIENNHNEKFILLIDEPELHLHPYALIKLIQQIKECKQISELWIASHSLFLVPLFNFKQILFMDNGSLSDKNSKMYEELYDKLVGLENINIFEFLTSLENWNYYQFIVECYCSPEAISQANIDDEQFQKYLESIHSIQLERPLEILDYGAGKCRIWECMQLLKNTEKELKNVTYTAFEPYPEENIKREFPLYKNYSDIINKKFDSIILMNVLHEIPINEWLQTFERIKNCLKDEGVLIFLEVMALTNGEQPYAKNGYLVLGDTQVRKLFNSNNIINLRKTSKEKSNCWIITKQQVSSVTGKSIISSLELLEKECEKKLKDCYLKRIEIAHNNDMKQKQIAARKYAFLSQQYINVQFALEQILAADTTKKREFPNSKISIKGVHQNNE
ncbi:MAG: AAA family ATPase [Lachnospiraceae bacterium]|nr:AAA family ATPase [Lachnospiraceae bacterium]